jgi:hypothetical protein
MVGVVGSAPTVSRSQSERVTRLRYTPVFGFDRAIQMKHVSTPSRSSQRLRPA